MISKIPVSHPGMNSTPEATEANQSTKMEKVGSEKSASSVNQASVPPDSSQSSSEASASFAYSKLAEGKLLGDAIAAKLQSQIATRSGGEVVSSDSIKPPAPSKLENTMVSSYVKGSSGGQDSSIKPPEPQGFYDLLVSSVKKSADDQDDSSVNAMYDVKENKAV